jgi:hypothetical protein
LIDRYKAAVGLIQLQGYKYSYADYDEADSAGEILFVRYLSSAKSFGRQAMTTHREVLCIREKLGPKRREMLCYYSCAPQKHFALA